MKKILVVAAHPDDEILGVGGTVRRLVNEGCQVWALILGEGMTSRAKTAYDTFEKELVDLHQDSLNSAAIVGYSDVYFSKFPDNKFDSIPLLDVVKEVEKYIEMIKPDTVFTHFHGDINIDHTVTYRAVLTATRPVGLTSVKELYVFETPSSTEWSFGIPSSTFEPNVFYDISSTINKKLEAMECYTSEIREYPHPRSLEALEVISKRWGTVVGCNYVEAFILVRDYRI